LTLDWKVSTIPDGKRHCNCENAAHGVLCRKCGRHPQPRTTSAVPYPVEGWPTCPCHGWRLDRCHQVQAADAARFDRQRGSAKRARIAALEESLRGRKSGRRTSRPFSHVTAAEWYGDMAAE
jgi:hypothetical protein